MGYTHYWSREEKVSDKKMKAIVKDFDKVLPEFKDLLEGWDGSEYKVNETPYDDGGFAFNGIGEEGHESFVFCPIKDDTGFNFCKTARKDYDIAVTSALIIIKNHLGKDIKISSDGDLEEWSEAIELCRKRLKYNVEQIKKHLFEEDK
jgi:hypothetical protein